MKDYIFKWQWAAGTPYQVQTVRALNLPSAVVKFMDDPVWFPVARFEETAVLNSLVNPENVGGVKTWKVDCWPKVWSFTMRISTAA